MSDFGWQLRNFKHIKAAFGNRKRWIGSLALLPVFRYKDAMPEAFVTKSEGNGDGPEWPSHFPPNCPATDIPDTNGPVYHYVWQDVSRDYKSAYDRGVYTKMPECPRVALSCFVKLDHAVQTRGILRGLFGTCKIACAELRPEHGRIKATPHSRNPGHHSLWLRAKHLKRCSELFRVIEE
jgi:hypothetical protein